MMNFNDAFALVSNAPAPCDAATAARIVNVVKHLDPQLLKQLSARASSANLAAAIDAAI